MQGHRGRAERLKMIRWIILAKSRFEGEVCGTTAQQQRATSIPDSSPPWRGWGWVNFLE